jgi:hypothetical protein
MPEEPKLLKIPSHFHNVEDVLATAAKLDLTNILVLSEREDGSLVVLDDGLTLAQANWLCDKLKAVLLGEYRLKE